MKKNQMKNKRYKFRCKLLLVGLALILAVALVNMAKAAMEDSGNEINNLLLSRQMKLFDPFTLKTVPITIQNRDSMVQSRNIILTERVYTNQGLNTLSSNLTIRPTIRIPFRPYIRTPFRPPLF